MSNVSLTSGNWDLTGFAQLFEQTNGSPDNHKKVVSARPSSNTSATDHHAVTKSESEKKEQVASKVCARSHRHLSESAIKQLNVLNNYFKKFCVGLDIYSDFQHLQFIEIAALGSVDLLGRVMATIQEQRNAKNVNSDFFLKAKDLAFVCCYDLCEFFWEQNILPWHFPIKEIDEELKKKLPLNAAFGELIALVKSEENQRDFRDCWAALSILLKHPNSKYSEQLAQLSSITKARNSKALTHYIVDVVAIFAKLIKLLNIDLYNNFKKKFVDYEADANTLEEALRRVTSSSASTFTQKVNLRSVKQPIIFQKTSGKEFEIAEASGKVQSALTSFKPLNKCLSLLNFWNNLEILQDPIENLAALERTDLPTMAWIEFDEQYPCFGSLMDKEDTNTPFGMYLVNIRWEADKVLRRERAICTLAAIVFCPIVRSFFEYSLHDWRDALAFDMAGLENEIETPPQAEAIESKSANSKKKARKKANAKAKSTASSTATDPHTHSTAPPKQETLRPSISQFLLDMRKQILDTVKLTPQVAPAALTEIALSRADRSKANQSYALMHFERSLEMLQYPVCFSDERSSSSNLLHDTLIRYAALKASLACESGSCANIFKRNPNAIVNHNQVYHARMEGLNPEHPAIKLIGRETLLYRFPNNLEEVSRKELFESWPHWMEDVVNKLSPSTDKSTINFDLPPHSSRIALSYAPTKLDLLQQNVRNVQRLSQQISRMITPDEHRSAVSILGIGKLLKDVEGFLQGIILLGHQRFLTVSITGIFGALQTLIDHTWVFALSQRGNRNLLSGLNDLHNIEKHLDNKELGQHLSDAQKRTLRQLHAPKACDYLPGHCAERKAIGMLPQMLSDLYVMAEHAADTQTVWVIQDKPGLASEEAILNKLNTFIDHTCMSITTVCAVIRQDVLGELT